MKAFSLISWVLDQLTGDLGHEMNEMFRSIDLNKIEDENKDLAQQLRELLKEEDFIAYEDAINGQSRNLGIPQLTTLKIPRDLIRWWYLLALD